MKAKMAHWCIGISVILALAACIYIANKPTATLAGKPVELNVSAALGLKEALVDLQKDYETKHPDVKIVYNLAAAGTLQRQIEQGAPVDIFISAANQQLDDLQKNNLIDPATRKNLVSNELVLVVPVASSLGLASFEDLAKDNVKKYGLGEPKIVPAGQYGIEVLKTIGVWDKVKDKAILTKDVREIMAQVETGNIDAGIVFSAVALTSDKVKIVAIAPNGTHEPIIFPGAILTNTTHRIDAEAFLNYLASPEGIEIFKRHGFSVSP